MELSVTFAFPMFYNSQTPLLVTPGFAVHYWEGPLSVQPLAPTDPPPADLPPRTYDAYLDAAWNPQITAWFGGELDFRIGVYSDFYRVASDSIRFTGKGMAVLTFSPSVKVKAGVWYLDRNVVKILPAGGICWTPNPDVYFNILFPNPKIGKRLTTWGNTDWWIYASGDYGGGKWAIRREQRPAAQSVLPRHERHLRHVRLQRHPRRRGPGVQHAAAASRHVRGGRRLRPGGRLPEHDAAQPTTRTTPCSSAPGWRTRKCMNDE